MFERKRLPSRHQPIIADDGCQAKSQAKRKEERERRDCEMEKWAERRSAAQRRRREGEGFEGGARASRYTSEMVALRETKGPELGATTLMTRDELEARDMRGSLDGAGPTRVPSDTRDSPREVVL